MTPQIDLVTSTLREMWGPPRGPQNRFYCERKFSEIDRIKRLFSAPRLGFSWLGIWRNGNPDAFSAAKAEIKQIEGPFVLATFGKKISKFIRLTGDLPLGSSKTWRKWASVGVSSIGKGCQTLLFASQATGHGSMGFGLDVVIAGASTLTSIIDSYHIGMKYIEIFNHTTTSNSKNYLLIKLIQTVLGLVCSLFTLIGLFFMFLQPIAPMAFAILGTVCLILNTAKYFFKKEEVEALSKIQYNSCDLRGIYDI